MHGQQSAEEACQKLRVSETIVITIKNYFVCLYVSCGLIIIGTACHVYM